MEAARAHFVNSKVRTIGRSREKLGVTIWHTEPTRQGFLGMIVCLFSCRALASWMRAFCFSIRRRSWRIIAASRSNCFRRTASIPTQCKRSNSAFNPRHSLRLRAMSRCSAASPSSFGMRSAGLRLLSTRFAVTGSSSHCQPGGQPVSMTNERRWAAQKLETQLTPNMQDDLPLRWMARPIPLRCRLFDRGERPLMRAGGTLPEGERLSVPPEDDLIWQTFPQTFGTCHRPFSHSATTSKRPEPGLSGRCFSFSCLLRAEHPCAALAKKPHHFALAIRGHQLGDLRAVAVRAVRGPGIQRSNRITGLRRDVSGGTLKRPGRERAQAYQPPKTRQIRTPKAGGGSC